MKWPWNRINTTVFCDVSDAPKIEGAGSDLKAPFGLGVVESSKDSQSQGVVHSACLFSCVST